MDFIWVPVEWRPLSGLMRGCSVPLGSMRVGVNSEGKLTMDNNPDAQTLEQRRIDFDSMMKARPELTFNPYAVEPRWSEVAHPTSDEDLGLVVDYDDYRKLLELWEDRL